MVPYLVLGFFFFLWVVKKVLPLGGEWNVTLTLLLGLREAERQQWDGWTYLIKMLLKGELWSGGRGEQ